MVIIKIEDEPWFEPEENEECCKNCMHYEVDNTPGIFVYSFGHRYHQGSCLETYTETEDDHICDHYERDE